MSSAWLRPCPFCGGRARRMAFLDSDMGLLFHGKKTFYFGCNGCKTVTSVAELTEEGAIALWNTRCRDE